MKKLICMVLAICTLLLPLSNAMAYSAAEGVAATEGFALISALKNLYESSVISRMAGRAGAATPNGAKGIAFEITFCDRFNLKHVFTDGLKASLSESSIDEIVDVKIFNKDGIVESIQCKDTVASINNTIKQVENSKYNGTTLVGTTETCKAFNEKAAAKGITQRMSDSKISTNYTSKIANKALAVMPSTSEILKNAGKNAGITSVITIGFSTLQSIIRGDDAYTALGNMAEQTAISAPSAFVSTVTTAEMATILTSLGVSAAVVNPVVAAVSFIIPTACGYVLCILLNETEFSENIAEALEDAAAELSEIYGNIEVNVASWDIPGKAAEAWDTAVEFSTEAKDSIAEFCADAKDTITCAGTAAYETATGAVNTAISDVKSLLE